MLNAFFTFVPSVDAVRASRQPNMEGDFLIALRAALGFARKSFAEESDGALGLSRGGHRALAIYENRKRSAVLCCARRKPAIADLYEASC